MSEKELLYIDDALGHLSYIKKHLNETEGYIVDENLVKDIQSYEKRFSKLYQKFENLL